MPTGHSPASNPADRATLRLQSTSIRNVITGRGLSVGSIAEQGEPYRKPAGGGMAQAAKARGNARDMPTWATMVGRKRSE